MKSRTFRTLWRRGVQDGFWMTAAFATLLFAFGWLFVWITSFIDLGALGALIKNFGPLFERLLAIPVASVTSSKGLISVLYVDPVVIFPCIIWAVARGSDVISGEISRGTMEMLLARPVRRSTILLIHVVQTLIGSAFLAAAVWLGNAVGILVVNTKETVFARDYVLSAINLFSLTICCAGIAALISAFDRHRWRTIGIAGGFIVVQLIVKVIARAWPDGGWLRYVTIFGAFEPQLFVTSPEDRWAMFWSHNGALIGMTALAYLIAWLRFESRDLPAPL